MRGKPLSEKEIAVIVALRQAGHSLPEIRKITSRGNGTVFKYIKDVEVLPEHKGTLKEKQGGSKARALREWSISLDRAKQVFPAMISQNKLLILAALYWGEGTKRELNIINSDPELLRVFVNCLEEIGVTRDMLRVTLRIYGDISARDAKKYWTGILNIPEKCVLNINILHGKKKGKLKYGMCRIRVNKSAQHFKLIMSMIELIKLKI